MVVPPAPGPSAFGVADGGRLAFAGRMHPEANRKIEPRLAFAGGCKCLAEGPAAAFSFWLHALVKGIMHAKASRSILPRLRPAQGQHWTRQGRRALVPHPLPPPASPAKKWSGELTSSRPWLLSLYTKHTRPLLSAFSLQPWTCQEKIRNMMFAKWEPGRKSGKGKLSMFLGGLDKKQDAATTAVQLSVPRLFRLSTRLRPGQTALEET